MIYKVGQFVAFIFYTIVRILSFGNLPPLLTISVIIIKKNKILAVSHSDDRGFTLPGGLIKQGETIKKAAEREVKEETGYNIRIRRFIGIYERLEGNFFHIPIIVFAYEGKIISGKLISSLEGTASWVDLKEIKQERDIISKLITNHLRKDAYDRK